MANPSIEEWAAANPVMAKKEATRLNAVDAELIGATPSSKEAVKEVTPSKTDIEKKCLQATDYKGCMEYHRK